MICNRVRANTRKNRCYKGVEVRISREDFIRWFMANDFEGCSVDRIKSTEHYELGNIQMLTLAENIAKDKVKMKDGKCECYTCKELKPMCEFSKDSRRQNGYSTLCKTCDSDRYYARKSKSVVTGKL